MDTVLPLYALLSKTNTACHFKDVAIEVKYIIMNEDYTSRDMLGQTRVALS